MITCPRYLYLSGESATSQGLGYLHAGSSARISTSNMDLTIEGTRAQSDETAAEQKIGCRFH